MQDYLKAAFCRLSMNFCFTLVHTEGHGTAFQTMHIGAGCATLREVYFSAFLQDAMILDLAISISFSAPDSRVFNSYHY